MKELSKGLRIIIAALLLLAFSAAGGFALTTGEIKVILDAAWERGIGDISITEGDLKVTVESEGLRWEFAGIHTGYKYVIDDYDYTATESVYTAAFTKLFIPTRLMDIEIGAYIPLHSVDDWVNKPLPFLAKIGIPLGHAGFRVDIGQSLIIANRQHMLHAGYDAGRITLDYGFVGSRDFNVKNLKNGRYIIDKMLAEIHIGAYYNTLIEGNFGIRVMTRFTMYAYSVLSMEGFYEFGDVGTDTGGFGFSSSYSFMIW